MAVVSWVWTEAESDELPRAAAGTVTVKLEPMFVFLTMPPCDGVMVVVLRSLRVNPEIAESERSAVADPPAETVAGGDEAEDPFDRALTVQLPAVTLSE